MTYKSLSLLSAIALVAGVSGARADGIAVQVAGRSPSAIRRDVIDAARKVCAETSQDPLIGDAAADQDCVNATVSYTLHQIAQSDADAMYAELADR